MQNNSDNIYDSLGLPLTAKWTEVKQRYDASLDNTEQMKKQADKEQIREIEKKQSHLKKLFTVFSNKVSAENGRMFQTRQALKSVGLSDTADWDTVQKRENEWPRTSSNDHNPNTDWDTLHRNRDLLLRDPKRKNHTILTAASALAGAGISLAAYHYLSNSDSDGKSLEDLSFEGDPHAESSEDIQSSTDLLEAHTQQLSDPVIHQDELDAYVTENSHLDGEMMSLLGLAPSPELTLTVDFKMQVLSALAKSI
ncbi:hypothetical protein GCM10027566_22680 [Arachidicoccus ginsenosidivorans]|uniref:Uncharacterized protein n=1 Tax=Arachidicoccus ginsenosidivorans TaxID=496057 RepID=A0A5B8VJS2_9BACT|nr:hypothetical protein [Arachidicoccus ginsenosidivorans]QEC71212.1 hypothetical protein FSB73_05490 [Arachidicoccus ginsenosidivorans]